MVEIITSVAIIISRNCNLNCGFCLSNSGGIHNDEVSVKEIIEFLDKQDKLRSIRVTGGEPLSDGVYEKTYELAKYCVDRGISIRLNTNGTFPREDFDLDPGIVSFQVSLDGPREIHDSIRGEGVFDKAVSFIRDKKSKGYNVRTMTVIDKQPIGELKKLSMFVDFELGAEPFSQIIAQVGRAKNNTRESDAKSIVTMAKQSGFNCRGDMQGCPSLMYTGTGTSVGIDSMGNIIPCPVLNQYTFGHISEFDEVRVRKEMINACNLCTCTYPKGEWK